MKPKQNLWLAAARRLDLLKKLEHHEGENITPEQIYAAELEENRWAIVYQSRATSKTTMNCKSIAFDDLPGDAEMDEFLRGQGFGVFDAKVAQPVVSPVATEAQKARSKLVEKGLLDPSEQFSKLEMWPGDSEVVSLCKQRDAVEMKMARLSLQREELQIWRDYVTVSDVIAELVAGNQTHLCSRIRSIRKTICDAQQNNTKWATKGKEVIDTLRNYNPCTFGNIRETLSDYTFKDCNELAAIWVGMSFIVAIKKGLITEYYSPYPAIVTKLTGIVEC